MQPSGVEYLIQIGRGELSRGSMRCSSELSDNASLHQLMIWQRREECFADIARRGAALIASIMDMAWRSTE